MKKREKPTSRSSPGLIDKRPSSGSSLREIDFNQDIGFLRQWQHYWRQTMAGLSIERMFMHLGLGQVKLKGKVIDYGAGADHPDYLGFLGEKVRNLTATDFYIEGKNIIKLDLEQKFHLSQTYDNFLCLNVLEHIYSTRKLLRSININLNKG